MNAATFDFARLIDADFLFFVAGAAWGVNAGLALFFLVSGHASQARMPERRFWISVAAAFLGGVAVGAADVVRSFAVLEPTAHLLEVLARGATAVTTLVSLVLLPRAFGVSLRQWRWIVGIAAVMLAIPLFITIRESSSALWLGVWAVGVAGGLFLASIRWFRGEPVVLSHRAALAALGILSLALGLMLLIRPHAEPPWNGGFPSLRDLDQPRSWQGATLAAGGFGAFLLLWYAYLQTCTLAQVRSRTGVLGLRPILLLPVLEAGVLALGGAWFVAASRQAEDYAARRVRAEVATAVADMQRELAGGAAHAPDPGMTRTALERLVRGPGGIRAAVAWRENSAGVADVFASVRGGDSSLPFDAAALLPPAREAHAARSESVVRWRVGEAGFDEALVWVPMAAASSPAWYLALVVDGRDLGGLVASHRLQALVILGLAVIVVAFAVVYTIRSLNEAELRLLKESAEAENAGRNAFLGMISHEIRTPLQSVLGYAELAEAAGLPETAARQVRAIRTQGAILLRIVQDILDFSALRGSALTLNPEVISLRELLDDVQRAMAGRAQAKGIVFSTEVDGAVPAWVTVDGVRLTQVLLNLAVNAVKFTERGGVRVALGCPGTADGKADIEILVSDTGPGINAAQMRRLFQPFRKMRDDDTPGGGGVGLGLAISRHIVELLGGTISAESADGEGAVFRLRLRLPLAEAPTDALAGESRTGSPAAVSIPSLAGLGVLLVDDNPYVRDLLRDFLQRLGARVTARAEGASALAACATESFDVILLDLRLPDYTGKDLAARLRSGGRSAVDPWIVGISAGVSDDEIEATLRCGVNDFMLKPISMAGLAETIRMSPAAARIVPSAPPRARAVGSSATATAAATAAFLSELEPIIDRLEQSCLEEDGARLGADAHYLANGCMATGFAEGLDVCREIEHLAEAGAFHAARQKIAFLRSRFAERGPTRGA